jgi:hypothetical protein
MNFLMASSVSEDAALRVTTSYKIKNSFTEQQKVKKTNLSIYNIKIRNKFQFIETHMLFRNLFSKDTQL